MKSELRLEKFPIRECLNQFKRVLWKNLTYQEYLTHLTFPYPIKSDNIDTTLLKECLRLNRIFEQFILPFDFNDLYRIDSVGKLLEQELLEGANSYYKPKNICLFSDNLKWCFIIKNDSDSYPTIKTYGEFFEQYYALFRDFLHFIDAFDRGPNQDEWDNCERKYYDWHRYNPDGSYPDELNLNFLLFGQLKKPETMPFTWCYEFHAQYDEERCSHYKVPEIIGLFRTVDSPEIFFKEQMFIDGLDREDINLHSLNEIRINIPLYILNDKFYSSDQTFKGKSLLLKKLNNLLSEYPLFQYIVNEKNWNDESHILEYNYGKLVIQVQGENSWNLESFIQEDKIFLITQEQNLFEIPIQIELEVFLVILRQNSLISIEKSQKWQKTIDSPINEQIPERLNIEKKSLHKIEFKYPSNQQAKNEVEE